MGIVIECKQCGKKKGVGNAKQKFCSTACSGIFNRKRRMIKCLFCGKKREVWSELKTKYCSQKCSGDSYRSGTSEIKTFPTIKIGKSKEVNISGFTLINECLNNNLNELEITYNNVSHKRKNNGNWTIKIKRNPNETK